MKGLFVVFSLVSARTRRENNAIREKGKRRVVAHSEKKARSFVGKWEEEEG